MSITFESASQNGVKLLKTFTLKRGVRFHDGSELTSADVVWSLRRHADPALGSKMVTIVAQFADVRADGRYGVIVRLNGANADLPAILSQSHFLIVRGGQSAPDGTGTGPFRLAEFQPGVLDALRQPLRSVVATQADVQNGPGRRTHHFAALKHPRLNFFM